MNTNVVIPTGSYDSAKISSNMFGANHLWDRDDFDGTFGEKITELGVTGLRFAGGGLSENFFRLDFPTNIPTHFEFGLENLVSFLNYCAENNLTPTIVIPTKRYIYDVDRGVAEVASFVERLTNGEFGPSEGVILEIGNEYYGGRETLAAQEYGNIAQKFVRAIEQNASHDVQIAVQIGKSSGDNETILSFFKDSPLGEYIDILVYHDYPWRAESIEARVAITKDKLGDWRRAGIDAETYVSEWNVGSSQTRTDEHDYGLPQANALLEQMSESMKAGVDMASIWGVQQNNRTSLTEDEGDNRVNFGGHIFRMMTDNLIDTRVVDLKSDKILDGQANIYVFESNSEVVVFVTANDLDEGSGGLDLTLDLSKYSSGYNYVWAESLNADGDPHNWNSIAVVNYFAPNTSGQGNSLVNIALTNDYEVVKIVFEKNNAGSDSMHIVGMDTDDYLIGGKGNDYIHGFDGDDVLSGSYRGDLLIGGNGNDTLNGDEGRDKLIGGRGDDALFGGDSGDKLVGGPGSDTMKGGNGDDTVIGSKGNDTLFGGAGDDRLVGGPGNDSMSGGQGADVFIFRDYGDESSDTIYDFNSGEDVLSFDLNKYGELEQFVVENSLIVVHGANTIELVGITELLSNDDFNWI